MYLYLQGIANSFENVVGDITQKGYEKKRRKLLLPFMTGHNQPNGQHPQHPTQLQSEVQLLTKNLEHSALDSIEQSYNATETIPTTSQLNEGSIPVPTISNIHSDVEERTSSFVPVPSVESSSVPSTPLENQAPSPKSNSPEIKDDGISMSVDPDPISTNEKETDVTVPAVPLHGNSQAESEEIVCAESANPTTSGAAQKSNILSPDVQPGTSNGFGAAPKIKGGKPRSRNRHKR